MPFGPYKGEAMANVPADYLLQLKYKGCSDEAVNEYIRDNLDVLEQEATQHKHEDFSDRY